MAKCPLCKRPSTSKGEYCVQCQSPQYHKGKVYQKKYLETETPDGKTFLQSFIAQAVSDSERGCIDAMIVSLMAAEMFDQYYGLMVDKVKKDYRRASLLKRQDNQDEEDRRDLHIHHDYLMQMGVTQERNNAVEREYQRLHGILDDMLKKW